MLQGLREADVLATIGQLKILAAYFRGRLYKRCTALVRRRSCEDSRLLFLAEFLEARVVPKRIEHRIEPEQRRSERNAKREWA